MNNWQKRGKAIAALDIGTNTVAIGDADIMARVEYCMLENLEECSREDPSFDANDAIADASDAYAEHVTEKSCPLSLWTNGADTYVARNAEHAHELMGKHLGYPYESEASPIEDWKQRVHVGPLSLTIEHDVADLTRETKTVDEWITSNGPGFLCSTEY
jgi:hypothetical protein